VVSLFVWLLPLDLSGMGDPTSSYATTGIALRVSGAFKPHHHDKVETPSVGINQNYSLSLHFIDICSCVKDTSPSCVHFMHALHVKRR
jgi:hypothetical protein